MLEKSLTNKCIHKNMPNCKRQCSVTRDSVFLNDLEKDLAGQDQIMVEIKAKSTWTGERSEMS